MEHKRLTINEQVEVIDTCQNHIRKHIYMLQFYLCVLVLSISFPSNPFNMCVGCSLEYRSPFTTEGILTKKKRFYIMVFRLIKF